MQYIFVDNITPSHIHHTEQTYIYVHGWVVLTSDTVCWVKEPPLILCAFIRLANATSCAPYILLHYATTLMVYWS